ncbi:MAG: GspE/PulE family protein [Peptoniphilus sp.]|nr:GspE/PulE family protein [Peptoniphilus sp.]MDY6044302.1 GspE/PulE family protein [Peptoniphilus sp.]
MAKNDIQDIGRRLGVRYVSEKDDILYVNADEPSPELRDDLRDVVGKEVCFVDDGELLRREENCSGARVDVVRLSETILDDAVKECCSDVHIEPADAGWRIRMRRNGTLFLYGHYPEAIYSEFVTRIKILARMNIGERRRPQDGRFTHNYLEQTVDIRVSAIPVKGKEKLVLRLLDRAGLDYSPEGIGLAGENLSLVHTLLRQPLGLVLICGPTGSGKTSTLYTFLKILNTVERNILTIEDPVEFAIEGINQMQVNPKADITFTSGLEAMLRQDPEVMMVGEIRSKETAEIALRSSITGHLIFSTLHTTDSPSAIIRLMDMGIEPYMISAGVIGIISQRLVRTLCPHCKRAVHTKDTYFQIEGTTYEGVGCPHCTDGYSGREAIFEIMPLSESMRALIKPGVTLDTLRRAARENGMVPLKEALREKIAKGTIDLDEGYRTIMTM